MKSAQPLQTGFAALHHRNYRLFWTGMVVSLTGSWMQSVAQSWLVLELTNSAFMVGLTVALQFAPVLAFGLLGGVFADRFNKRRALLVTQSAAMIQALLLGLLVLTGQARPGLVMALASFLGLINAFDMPLRQSFVVEMVGREDVMNAIALNSSAFNLARIVGPALGGILIAAYGVGPVFFVNAVSYLAVLWGVFLIREGELSQRPKVEPQGVWESMAVGLRFVRATPAVQVPILLVGAVATFGMNWSTLLPVMARDVFSVGSRGFGFLMASLGVGSLLAALFVAFFPKLDPAKTMLGGGLAFGLLEGLFALSPHLRFVPVSAFLLLGVGFCTVAMTATANTTIQRLVPNELRGRVMSIYVTIFAGSTPIGSLFAGTLARYFGAPVALGAGAALSALSALWAWRVLNRTVGVDAIQTSHSPVST